MARWHAPTSWLSTLSTVAEYVAGPGPPNRRCLTIFPPEWRVADWYVAMWVEQMHRYDPAPGLWFAGIIFVIVLSVHWCICCGGRR